MLRDVHFDGEMEKKISALLRRYPTKQAALLPVLWLCQERWGWLPASVLQAVAKRLELSPAFVEGVTTFYTMYNTQPTGKYLVQVCTTLSCQLCGASGLTAHLKERLGIDSGETTPDGRFTLLGVQCLGACGEGPVVQINNDYYTNVTVEMLDQILDELPE
ncbi:MAG: NADH-quinone oxidoreductase subunit NuoE [Acidobacteria bacterium]|nr:NADH-quinone oxidoreductase subunit NuoE [Acidobacteriota bacterium]